MVVFMPAELAQCLAAVELHYLLVHLICDL
jgi:hypothetical protein